MLVDVEVCDGKVGGMVVGEVVLDTFVVDGVVVDVEDVDVWVVGGAVEAVVGGDVVDGIFGVVGVGVVTVVVVGAVVCCGVVVEAAVEVVGSNDGAGVGAVGERKEYNTRIKAGRTLQLLMTAVCRRAGFPNTIVFRV